MRKVRIIAHGEKKRGRELDSALERLRKEGPSPVVKTTRKAEDVQRFMAEALRDSVDVVVAGGGDGTINAVVNALMAGESAERPALAVLPIGTANDFATGCGIPLDPYEALRLAAHGEVVEIDVVRVNGVHFVNVASGGFGAEVTDATPDPLKRAVGGSAYALVGLVKAVQMEPYEGRIRLPEGEAEGSFVALAIANGRQAGGGFEVAPKARLDDGLMDLLFIDRFEADELTTVIEELRDLEEESNRFVHYRQISSCEVEVSGKLPINLDGEPHRWHEMRFEVMPTCLRVVLPADCPLVAGDRTWALLQPADEVSR